ncbi:MAG: NYN domain-containing protein [Chloroflexota bacterium]|nr:NYN domain-containing protein [Chloroflexota bacterium]
MDDRVAIFIDGSNLYHALRANMGRYDLNFALFAEKLSGERRLFRIYYYNVLQDPSQRAEGSREQQDFLNALKETPYLEVRLGGTKMSQGTRVEKGIDVMLATDLLHFAWIGLYEVAVLVSGDSDFAYALQAVKNMGKHVEVAYFESNISKDLLDIADKRHQLDSAFFKGLWKGKRPPRRRQSSKPGAKSGTQKKAEAPAPS